MRGGENMEIFLSLLIHAATVFVKVVTKKATLYLIKHVKDRTALTGNKDGSDVE